MTDTAIISPIFAVTLPTAFPIDISTLPSKAAITETGAASIRDMGKVMGALKAKYAGNQFGVVWAFVQPMITALIYIFVFQVVHLLQKF